MTNKLSGKHTPGPWVADGRNVFAFMPNPDYKPGRFKEINRMSVSIQQCPTKEEEIANAHLIASAPELLEALIKLCDYSNHSPAYHQAKKVIAKAEGRE